MNLIDKFLYNGLEVICSKENILKLKVKLKARVNFEQPEVKKAFVENDLGNLFIVNFCFSKLQLNISKLTYEKALSCTNLSEGIISIIPEVGKKQKLTKGI